MYYPLSKIQTNLYTNGQEYVFKANNENYIGYYWKTSNGRTFAGKTPQGTINPELIKFTSNRDLIVPSSSPKFSEIALAYDAPYVGDNPDLYNETEILNYLRLKNIPTVSPPVSIIPTYLPSIPTEKDYKIGEFKRYFCKKINEIIYTEIDKDTYDKLVAKNSQFLYALYLPFSINWKLTGDEKQVYIVNRNIVELAIKNFKLYKFKEYLRNDFAKYYK